MGKSPPKIVIRLLTGVTALLLVTTAYLGYRLMETSGKNRAVQSESLAKLEKRLSKIESDLQVLMASGEVSDPGTRTPAEAALPRPATGPSSKGVPTALNELSAELQSVQETLASTGLDRLAAGDDLDPEVFQSMYEEYAEQKRVLDYRRSLQERNESQHRQDDGLFDEYLNELYERARPRRGTGTDSEDREEAFAEMLATYPDAYATAMVIAERAFTSIWSRDQAGVENYYAMLQERDSDIAGTVVTDRGIEALPNIELYLVRRYLSAGRDAEAAVLVESLQDNYAESLVFTGGRRRGGRWATVSEALERIDSSR